MNEPNLEDVKESGLPTEYVQNQQIQEAHATSKQSNPPGFIEDKGRAVRNSVRQSKPYLIVSQGIADPRTLKPHPYEFRIWGTYEDTYGALRPCVETVQQYYSLGHIVGNPTKPGWTPSDDQDYVSDLQSLDLWSSLLFPPSNERSHIDRDIFPRERFPMNQHHSLYLGHCGFNKPLKVVHSQFHCIILTSTGHVLTMGDNSRGELGLGEEVGFVHDQPHTIVRGLPHLDPIVDIAANGYTSLALTKSGELYFWGDSTFLCISRDKASPVEYLEDLRFRPTLFDPLKLPSSVNMAQGSPIIAFAANDDHFVVIDQEMRLWEWGRVFGTEIHFTPVLRHEFLSIGGSKKQNSDNKTKTIGPMKFKVALTNDYGIVLDSWGKLHAWGMRIPRQFFYQLEANMDSECTSFQGYARTPIPLNSTYSRGIVFEDVSAGSHHALLIASFAGKRSVYSVGDNSFGQLGKLNCELGEIQELTSTNGCDPLIISAGARHSGIVSTDGQLYLWGYPLSNSLISPADDVALTRAAHRSTIIASSSSKKIMRKEIDEFALGVSLTDGSRDVVPQPRAVNNLMTEVVHYVSLGSDTTLVVTGLCPEDAAQRFQSRRDAIESRRQQDRQ